jgi:hypothetical protein
LVPGSCPALTIAQTQAAVDQAQTLPTSAPSAQPYWQIPAPTVNCQVFVLLAKKQNLNKGVLMAFVNETNKQLIGTAPVPAYFLLKTLLPASYSINAFYGSYLPAGLDELTACFDPTSLTDDLAGSFYTDSDLTGKWSPPCYAGFNPNVQNPNVKSGKQCNEG